MKNLSYVLVLAALAAGCQSSHKDSAAKADSTNQLKDSAEKTYPLTSRQEISGDDAKFAVKAASGGIAEVELGKLAQQKAVSKAVKDFGAMMVKDHSAANDELTALANSKHIALPQQLDEESAKLKAELSAKNGKDFDKAYADAMIKDHEEDTAEFARAIKVVKYPEMAAFAKKTLPVLKMHLSAAQKVKASLKD